MAEVTGEGGVAAEIPNLGELPKQQDWELCNDTNHPNGFQRLPGAPEPSVPPIDPALTVLLLLLPKLSRDTSHSVQNQRLVTPRSTSCPRFSPCDRVGSCAVGERGSAQGRARRLPDGELTASQVLLLLCKVLCSILNKKPALSSGQRQVLRLLLHGGRTDAVRTAEKRCLVPSVGVFYFSTTSCVFGREIRPASSSSEP